MPDPRSAQEQTIADFGEQWPSFHDIDTGYYGEDVLFDDILSPFVDETQLTDCHMPDIGSWTGRIVRMLSHAHPSA
ncbi:MAG: hypothetical protein QF921_17925 [Pseudomonadales bacterium]|jgi:hypothetical protein|nr:hypothetical protein [Pseudomonadales bacterium]MDP6470420.1 hypothetical protein [Pseudomonadales bacterium]MDP6827720.1 hypothetical protein [Pseudomonadales bacterium]MDP6973365.1 hypothetical protein [Pseudomonadales bacterium]|tara:strand:+ start:1216 stop:1443 length:228 start_codon:yes stop_codon:yes gene_type:complete